MLARCSPISTSCALPWRRNSMAFDMLHETSRDLLTGAIKDGQKPQRPGERDPVQRPKPNPSPKPEDKE